MFLPQWETTRQGPNRKERTHSIGFNEESLYHRGNLSPVCGRDGGDVVRKSVGWCSTWAGNSGEPLPPNPEVRRRSDFLEAARASVMGEGPTPTPRKAMARERQSLSNWEYVGGNTPTFLSSHLLMPVSASHGVNPAGSQRAGMPR